ncbi:MAG: hypothetical protein RBR32_06650 [Bacteroidales bacterium]|nr:hypothetical protein [Bacteroidales bacterium]
MKIKLNSKKTKTPREKVLKKREQEVDEDDFDLDDENINDLRFISSVSYNTNLALTGDINKGHPIGRIIIVTGDYSTGKTEYYLEIIAKTMAEYLAKGKKIKVVIDDAEYALDDDFARKLGVPKIIKKEPKKKIPDKYVELRNSELIEDFHGSIYEVMEDYEDYDLILYCLDSIDSLSDRSEKDLIEKNLKKLKKREDGNDDNVEKLKQSYGAQFAKYMSQLFRNLRADIKNTNTVLILIAQLREDLGNKGYQKKTTSRGGKAQRFYASQIIELLRAGKLYKTQKVKNTSKIPYGSTVKALVTKNKVYPEGRHTYYDIILNPIVGVDNVGSLIDFCTTYKGLEKSGKGKIEWNGKSFSRDKLREEIGKNKKQYKKLLKLAQDTWNEIEEEAKIDINPKWKWLDNMEE